MILLMLGTLGLITIMGIWSQLTYTRGEGMAARVTGKVCIGVALCLWALFVALAIGMVTAYNAGGIPEYDLRALIGVLACALGLHMIGGALGGKRGGRR